MTLAPWVHAAQGVGVMRHPSVERNPTMEEGTAAQFATINVKLDLLIEQRTDHEVRLRVLEASRWKIVGMATAASATVAILGPYVLK